MPKTLKYRFVGANLVIPAPLYCDDRLLAEIILGENAAQWTHVRSMFERQGMPAARAAVRGLYYVPAVLKFLDRREGLATFEDDFAEDGPDHFGP